MIHTCSDWTDVRYAVSNLGGKLPDGLEEGRKERIGKHQGNLSGPSRAEDPDMLSCSVL